MDPPPCKCGRTQVQYNTVAMYYIIQDNTIQYNIAQEAKEGINMDPPPCKCGRTQVQYNTVAMYYIIQDNTIQYNIDTLNTTGDFPRLVQALQ